MTRWVAPSSSTPTTTHRSYVHLRPHYQTLCGILGPDFARLLDTEYDGADASIFQLAEQIMNKRHAAGCSALHPDWPADLVDVLLPMSAFSAMKTTMTDKQLDETEMTLTLDVRGKPVLVPRASLTPAAPTAAVNPFVQRLAGESDSDYVSRMAASMAALASSMGAQAPRRPAATQEQVAEALEHLDDFPDPYRHVTGERRAKLELVADIVDDDDVQAHLEREATLLRPRPAKKGTTKGEHRRAVADHLESMLDGVPAYDDSRDDEPLDAA